ncbi:hypothetical protein C3489_04980 [Streptomyces sp. Ru71]|uniref:hypothetical protein n=1 Tax=Streptomyces sp. Ru71 TaxID=2080746 RepID=UPI000CDD0899|nr:hypothetical protein [Streptomyces sp. Ru71]POX56410.1 hypothetical protein C3489_04980 [Streptomyces sp. Ru71]
MRVASGHRSRGALTGLLVLCALLLGTAASATAADDSTPASTKTADDSAAGQAAYLAGRLRTDPVYVTDQLPREVPVSTAAPFLRRQAQRTGVPTYVILLPTLGTRDGKALLGAVHDRLGRDGLYVLLDDMGVQQAAPFGVRAPADDAWTVTVYEVPYDAGPLYNFQTFVDVIAEGPAKAAARAEAAREKYGDGAEPAEMYLGPVDRDNQSFLTGILLTGVPLLILLSARYVRRRGEGAKGARRRTGWIAPAAALLAAAAIAVTAPLVFDQTKSGPEPPPTEGDLTARVTRVATALAHDPVYEDPESPRVLDAAQRRHLHERIASFARSTGGGPVYIALVPQTPDDESGGDEEVFAAAVQARLHRDGVYVVADPSSGSIDVFNHGLRLDGSHLTYDLPESIAYGDDKADRAVDHLLGERLDALMTHLDRTPRTTDPDTFTAADPEPVEGTALRPLYSGDFWPGLAVGALAAGLLFGVLAALLGIVRALLRRRRPAPATPLKAPTAPSLSYLRRTARTELKAFLTDLTLPQDDGPAASRIRDCYDASLLLLDGDATRLARTREPATLLAVIVLARAGRAARAGEVVDRYCAVNPLHGPAAARRQVRVHAHDGLRRRLPVCEQCRDTSVTNPASVPGRFLTLPAPGGGPRVRHDDSGGPLTALADGVVRLTEKVRESAHVA